MLCMANILVYFDIQKLLAKYLMLTCSILELTNGVRMKYPLKCYKKVIFDQEINQLDQNMCKK